MSKIRYNKQIQNKILKEYLTGISINDLSESHSISKSTIYRWIKINEEEKSNTKYINNKNELQDLISENSKLKNEVAVLKKAIEILSVKS